MNHNPISEHFTKLTVTIEALRTIPIEKPNLRLRNIEKLKNLLELDRTEINRIDDYFYSCETLLFVATTNGDFEVASMLLDYGADPNIICSDVVPFMRNCLTGVCDSGAHVSLPMVSLLIDRGANINAKMPGTNRTALHFACDNGNAECVSFLIDRGADMSARDHEGLTPLWYAVKHDLSVDKSTLNVVHTLVLHGANIRERNSIGQTLLHQTARAGQSNMRLVKYLVDSGVEDVRDINDHSASDIAFIAAGPWINNQLIARMFTTGLHALLLQKNHLDKLNVIAHGYHLHNRHTNDHPSTNGNHEHSHLISVGRDPLKMIMDFVHEG